MTLSLPRLFSCGKLHPHIKGVLAEKVALIWYMVHGYRPFGGRRNARIQTDLIMRRGSVVVLVEVKWRPTLEKGYLALHSSQKRRQHRQLAALAGRHPQYTFRLDLFLVFGHPPFIQHISGLDLPPAPTYHDWR